jgi:carbon-monoxide dehydrogenase medium subunit
MVPAPFDYRAAGSIDEALELLHEHGDEAKVMAGGQSLIPLLKLRLSAPGLIVDIGRVHGLDAIRVDGDGVGLGALVRHVDIERSAELAAACPILTDAAPLISDPLVRNRGTVGGSLCHADPAGDWASVMIALDARLVLRSSDGERVVPASGFFAGPFTTELAPDEALVEIRIPVQGPRSAGAYLKLERKVGDFATVGAAVQVALEDGVIARAGIGLTAVGPTNVQATAAEQALAGSPPTESAIREAARLAAGACEPRDDIRGSADYKRDVVRVFVQRGLRAALNRAQGVQA